MYYNNISDFEALMSTPDNSADKKSPAGDAFAIIASLALALVAISIVFN
ncbi:MAG: hypothetical protein WBN96_04665 [Gammaproteobacteria bacterium]